MRDFVLTIYAAEEMENDRLSIFDVENCILTGEITEKLKDRNTGEWKYVVKGKCYSSGREFLVVVGKISITDKLVIITVFRD
ncbi:MAG: DUF4258 domain-containing protein [Chitinispirillaceae bacterium]|nr:DUF4258 domain-containing protein [Chitinispirillaceae bacterium]